jgi:hypothetical protein
MLRLSFILAVAWLLVFGGVANATFGDAKVVVDGRLAISMFMAAEGDTSRLAYDIAPVVRWLELPKYWVGSEIGITFGENANEELIESVFLNAVFDLHKYEHSMDVVKDGQVAVGLFARYDIVTETFTGGLTASGYFF